MSIGIDAVGNPDADPIKKTVCIDNEVAQVVEFDVHIDHVVHAGAGGYQEKDGSRARVMVWKKTLGDRLHRHLRKGASVHLLGSGRLASWVDDKEMLATS